MRQIAIVGSGPAGYYTAEAALRQWGDAVHVDIFDAMPVPFGLIRTGVAPDHQAIKEVSHRYETVARSENVRFVGNVRIGRDVSVAELRELYDAVILATGAPSDLKPGIPGEDLANVFGSAAVVGWYNGHPDYAALAPNLETDTAVVIGNGNVALDVVRILAKSEQEFAGSDIVGYALDRLKASRINKIVILGRRGPHQIGMSAKELSELGHLARACPRVDPADLPPLGDDAVLAPAQRKALAELRAFAQGRPCQDGHVAIEFHFFAAPKTILGDGKASKVEVERTRLVDGKAVGTGETCTIDAGLVISCIGYRTPPIPDVPYNESLGRFANEDGRIAPGLYCVGWARRGPTGTIGTNRPDGFAIIEKVAADIGEGAEKRGRPGFDALAAERGVHYVKFTDWQKIDEAEIAHARTGAPREKFVALDEMIKATEQT